MMPPPRVSHLPPEMELTVVGHGMNAAELEANPAFSSYFVQDLNADGRLARLADASFDAVLCCAGLQYLRRPEHVLAEVARVVRPGGLVILSFSTHSFEEKATRAWLSRKTLQEKRELTKRWLAAGGLNCISEIVRDPLKECDLAGERTIFDPFCCIIADKSSAELTTAAIVSPALVEMDAGQGVAGAALERWRMAYNQMARDAEAMGIPASAVPSMPVDADEETVRQARDLLRGIIASFVSSGL
jgi:hypothetical protein